MVGDLNLKDETGLTVDNAIVISTREGVAGIGMTNHTALIQMIEQDTEMGQASQASVCR